MSMRFSAVLFLALLFPAGVVHAKGDARYEASLIKVFDLTYRREIVDMSVDEAVEGFLQGIEKEEGALKTCPAAKAAMTDFAQHQFKDAVVAYFNSDEFRDIILEGMRKHYTQADLDAYLAFAATPAGATFIDHSLQVETEVQKLVKERMEHLEDSPQIAKMLSELGAALIVPMMKCQQK